MSASEYRGAIYLFLLKDGIQSVHLLMLSTYTSELSLTNISVNYNKKLG